MQAEIAEKLPDYAQTMRFSPGYGDMPLSVQGEFLSCINAEKRCGVSVTEGGMLTPIKTITAVFGLEKKGALDENQIKKGCGTEEACSICERKDSCSLSFFAKN